MKHLLPFAAATMLVGCVSMGTDYDSAAVDRLRIGMTKAEVVQLLGQPNQVINNSDGTQRLVWVHSTGNVRGERPLGRLAVRRRRTADRSSEVADVNEDDRPAPLGMASASAGAEATNGT